MKTMAMLMINNNDDYNDDMDGNNNGSGMSKFGWQAFMQTNTAWKG